MRRWVHTWRTGNSCAHFGTMCTCFVLPHRVVPLFKVLRESPNRVADITFHEGKTKSGTRDCARTSGRRTTLLGRYPHHEESSVRMAIVVAQRQPPGQPHVAHASSKPVWQVRTRPRRRHLGNRGGPSSTSPWRSRGTEFCARDRHPANEGGLGLRSATRCAVAAYFASWADALGHDQPEKPSGRQLGGADHGG